MTKRTRDSVDSNPLLLVVDDDDDVRSTLEEGLRVLGYRALGAASGPEALSVLQNHHVSVVVADWMMPGMDGLELCRRVRHEHHERYVYFVFITALSGKKNYLQAMDAGADDFITKPVDLDLLGAKLAVAERILDLRRELGVLQRLLPICMHCKKIQDSGGAWQPLERYLHSRTGAEFSHGLCPDCLRERYGGDQF